VTHKKYVKKALAEFNGKTLFFLNGVYFLRVKTIKKTDDVSVTNCKQKINCRKGYYTYLTGNCSNYRINCTQLSKIAKN
jgi:hypothetical protein